MNFRNYIYKISHFQRKHFKITFVISLFTLLIAPNLYAQNKNIEINGIILDEFNSPVPYVAIGIVKKYIGTASTEDGEFSFLISKNEFQDSLSISSLGFDPFKIKIEDYLKQEKKEIILKETITALNEITLLSPMDYVQKAIKSLKETTVSQPHQLDILYRRAATESGKSKFFVENFIKLKDRGPAYYFGNIEVAEARKSADYRVWKREQWTHNINYMATGNPIRASDKQPNFRKFIWKKIGDTSYEGEDVVILEGTNESKSWDKMTLYIGVDNFGIYKVEKGSSLYLYKKHIDGKLYLSYHVNEWGWDSEKNKDMIPREYWNTTASKISYRSEAFVYNIETNKKKIDVNSFGGDKDMGSLDLPYHTEFWKNLSMPPDTKFFKKIKNELESLFGVSLEKQFEIVNE
jgi:hypothetical protein